MGGPYSGSPLYGNDMLRSISYWGLVGNIGISISYRDNSKEHGHY